jgi:drug/metabolite transporter (DMT)-like permease
MQSGYKIGVLLGLTTALMYASYLLIFRKLGSAASLDSSMPAVAVISIAATVFLGIYALPFGESFAIPDSTTLLVLLGYGVICQLGGWVVISMGIPLVEASRVGLILLLQPALAFVWDILIFGRSISPIEIGGAVIALAAIYLGGLSRPEKKPAATQ